MPEEGETGSPCRDGVRPGAPWTRAGGTRSPEDPGWRQSLWAPLPRPSPLADAGIVRARAPLSWGADTTVL